MSIRVMSWAWALPLPHGDKLVLMALADHSDDNGLCWPGTKGVAEKCNLDQRTVVRHITSLEEAGFLTRIVRYREDGSQTSNAYQLCIEGTKLSPPDDATVRGGMAISTGGDGATVTPRTIREPSLEPSISLESAADAASLPQNGSGTSRKVSQRKTPAVSDAFKERMVLEYGAALGETGVREAMADALAHKAVDRWKDTERYVGNWIKREVSRRGEQAVGTTQDHSERSGVQVGASSPFDRYSQ